MQDKSCARVVSKICDDFHYKEQKVGGVEISADELQPIRFQGQFFDTETGLHYNRFRYYDCDLGMFISRDPIGLMGGDNVFKYAPNPVSWIDPLGLASVELCDALRKLAKETDSPWIRGDDLYLGEIGKEQDLIDKIGVPYTIDGVDLQYLLVQHRFVRSTGAAKPLTWMMSTGFFSLVYEP